MPSLANVQSFIRIPFTSGHFNYNNNSCFCLQHLKPLLIQMEDQILCRSDTSLLEVLLSSKIYCSSYSVKPCKIGKTWLIISWWPNMLTLSGTYSGILISQTLSFTNLPIVRVKSHYRPPLSPPPPASVQHCNFTPDFSNSPIFQTNFRFPWSFVKSGFHCSFIVMTSYMYFIIF